MENYLSKKKEIYWYKQQIRGISNALLSKRSLFHMISFIWHFKKCILQGHNTDQWIPEAGIAGRGLTKRGYMRTFMEWWKCSVFWLWWWLHNCICKLYRTEHLTKWILFWGISPLTELGKKKPLRYMKGRLKPGGR